MSKKKFLFHIKGGTEWMGGLHYIKNLIKTVRLYNPLPDCEIEVGLLVHTQDQVQLFNDVKHDIAKIYVVEQLLSNAGLPKRGNWWLKRRSGSVIYPMLDELIRNEGYDFAYPCLPRKDFKEYRFAEWIPDFQYRHFPEGSNEDEIRGRKQAFENICRTAPLVYLSSEHARKDCEELFPFSKPKLRVMQFCVYTDEKKFTSPLSQVLNKYHIPRRYFIISNLLAPTKNLEVVIKAISLLKKQGHNIHVAVTGDIHDYRNPFFKNKIFQLISSENVRENIIFLGLIDRMDQKQLLVNSISIVQPSRFEGWNTLVEEAKCLDKQILLSDIPVHVEQAPRRGVYFKDNDAQDLAQKLLQLYQQPGSDAEVDGIGISPGYENNLREFAAHFINTSLFEKV